MKKTAVLAAMLAAAAMLLSGCRFKTADELYTLPQAPADYQNLQTSLKAVQQELESSFGTVEYAAPLTGDNTQTVQLQDLDGDGVEEAVAFFRVTGADQPLKIYIFSQQEDETYTVSNLISGDGTAISSVYYEDLNGNGEREVVVSWQMSDELHILGAYEAEKDVVDTLLSAAYSQYRILDMDQDGEMEILLVQMPTEGDSAGSVELYEYVKESRAMEKISSAPISNSAAEFYEMRDGAFSNGTCGLYLTCKMAGGGLITDLYTGVNGVLKNITLNKGSGSSIGTICSQAISPRDINGDGILELPSIEFLPQAEGSSANITWLVRWVQYSAMGWKTTVYTTFYNESEGWYLILPEEWEGEITVSQSGSSSLGLRATTFAHWEEDNTTQSFLTIYRLTGSNRFTRASSGSRFVLQEDSSVIYAAEFSNGWDCGLTENALTSRFRLIETEW